MRRSRRKAETENCKREIGGRLPEYIETTFDREFRSCVASAACLLALQVGSGIGLLAESVPPEVHPGIASCPAAFAFPRMLRGEVGRPFQVLAQRADRGLEGGTVVMWKTFQRVLPARLSEWVSEKNPAGKSDVKIKQLIMLAEVNFFGFNFRSDKCSEELLKIFLWQFDKRNDRFFNMTKILGSLSDFYLFIYLEIIVINILYGEYFFMRIYQRDIYILSPSMWRGTLLSSWIL